MTVFSYQNLERKVNPNSILGSQETNISKLTNNNCSCSYLEGLYVHNLDGLTLYSDINCTDTLCVMNFGDRIKVEETSAKDFFNFLNGSRLKLRCNEKECYINSNYISQYNCMNISNIDTFYHINGITHFTKFENSLNIDSIVIPNVDLGQAYYLLSAIYGGEIFFFPSDWGKVIVETVNIEVINYMLHAKKQVRVRWEFENGLSELVITKYSSFCTCVFVHEAF